jgi:hypothetical protein
LNLFTVIPVWPQAKTGTHTEKLRVIPVWPQAKTGTPERRMTVE